MLAPPPPESWRPLLRGILDPPLDSSNSTGNWHLAGKIPQTSYSLHRHLRACVRNILILSLFSLFNLFQGNWHLAGTYVRMILLLQL